VRLNALDSLGKQDDPEAIPAISDCLKDIDERIRLSALNILKNLQEKRNQEIREARERQENATRERAEKGSKKTEAK
jgi:HEAT repeat protein